MNFPSSPTIGQTYTFSGRTWRFNGTGWQLVTDLSMDEIAGLQDALDDKQDVLGFTPENAANKGQANGYASLGANGLVPEAQLPEIGGSGLGVDQTWQDVAASRAFNTVYQNVTGKPIEVAVVIAVGPSATATFDVSANNSAWSLIASSSAELSYLNAQTIIPPGFYYRASTSGGVTKTSWKELR